jgi:hypothetical protein
MLYFKAFCVEWKVVLFSSQVNKNMIITTTCLYSGVQFMGHFVFSDIPFQNEILDSVNMNFKI